MILLAAHARLAEERLLASSIYQDGGWRLLLDGRPFPLGTANGPFVAAWLPAGEHRVELVYRAPGFLAGLGRIPPCATRTRMLTYLCDAILF